MRTTLTMKNAHFDYIRMGVELYDHQISAIKNMKNGCILCGGVGSGKSRTSIAYYFFVECGGKLAVNGKGHYEKMKKPLDLYIITTARKRDTYEWEEECVPFLITKDKETNKSGVKLTIDSWNNVQKYADVKNAFFIFDEQRVVGYGKWSKSFIKIAKNNRWILLSATPGDTWSDYIPVFIANGFYKNKTDFVRQHCVYSRYSKYPKIDHYVYEGKLNKLRKEILINMEFDRPTISHKEYITTQYDKGLYSTAFKDRWNPFTKEPIKDAGDLCRVLQKIVNSDISKISALLDIYEAHNKVIIFYNYNYELEILKKFCDDNNFTYAEWNGHKHEPIPNTNHWFYLVQYTAGAEGWNCIKTNVIIFYSQSYSYKQMIQAAGRIDRLNTPYKDLYYYHFVTKSSIDSAIQNSLRKKKNFNEKSFVKDDQKFFKQ